MAWTLAEVYPDLNNLSPKPGVKLSKACLADFLVSSGFLATENLNNPF